MVSAGCSEAGYARLPRNFRGLGANPPLARQIDSLLGATCQETLYSTTRKMVVHSEPHSKKAEDSDDVKRIAGLPLLSNNGVNFVAAGGTAGLVFWWACR